MNSTEETRATAQDVLDYIHAYPERHSQLDFYWVDALDKGDLDAAVISDNICNTTMCIAGTVLFQREGIAGLRSINDEATGIIVPETIAHAGELLGLNEQEAMTLFYEMDNENAIQMLKKVIVGEEILSPYGDLLPV